MKFSKTIVAIAAVAAAITHSSIVQAGVFGVGTMSQGTITYAAGAAISKVVSNKTELQLRVQPFSGTTQVVPLLNSGEMDFALASVIESEAALNGKVVFKGHANPNLRVVAAIFPVRTGYFVRKDSKMNSVADLKGKVLPVSYAAQAMIRSVTNAVLAAGGISTKDVEGVPVPNISRGADDFATGKTDAFFFAVGAGKVAQVAAKVGGLKLLPIGSDDVALRAARDHASSVYITTVTPSKRLAGVEAPTPIVTYDYLLLAGKHVSDETVYEVTKALHGNKDSLIKSFGVFRGFKPEEMAKKLPVEFHSGAIKFYAEAGILPTKN